MGKLVISLPPDVYTTRDFSEGMAPIAIRVPNTRGRWGFVNETGEVVIRPQFHVAKLFPKGWQRSS
jgi:hypothetical protein